MSRTPAWPTTRWVGKPEAFQAVVDHGVEGVAHHDENGVGAETGDVGADRLDDRDVLGQEVVAAHARFAGQAGGDDDYVAVGGVLVAVGADDVAVVAFDGGGLHEVEGLALGHAFDDVQQHDVAEFLGGGPMGAGGADVAGSDDGDLGSFGHGVFSFGDSTLIKSRSR